MKSRELAAILKRLDLNFLTGVPDTTLRNFLSYVEAHPKHINHQRAANEGQAVALAAGHHLATGRIPVVYMQNSGLGNAVNSLTSLADKEVYGIPMILLIGWRGAPGTEDEPQHIKMGKITLDLLKILDIPFELADGDKDKTERRLRCLKEEALKKSCPTALVFPRGVVEKEADKAESPEGMKREEALDILLDKMERVPLVSTTGYTSREIFALRENRKEGHETDFLCVGSMGHASSVALAIAKQAEGPVYLIDGDGALAMHMGAAATIGSSAPANLRHIVIDNGSHESTGGQPTVLRHVDWKQFFKSMGYKTAEVIDNTQDLEKINFNSLSCPAALVIKVIPGTRRDLGRPTSAPIENKNAFMKFLKESEFKS